MILLLGGSGYLGQAFVRELEQRKRPFKSLTRREVDYTRFDLLLSWHKSNQPEFVINAAGYTGRPNVDGCEDHKADALAGNTLLPLTIAHACAVVGVPWAQVASGCIFSGAKIVEGGKMRVVTDLMQPGIRSLAEANPAVISGFTETDGPNFTFRNPPCSFYSGTQGLGQEAIGGIGQSYVWRLRMPFDEFDGARNYLSKVQRYAKVYDNVNSISHRGDFVRAGLDLWECHAPFGTYNLTNPGFVTTRQVVQLIQKHLKPAKPFEFWSSDVEFYQFAAKTPRSNCVLDTHKLLSTGVKIRPVQEALEDSLRNWKPER